jgi:hypothetical protein
MDTVGLKAENLPWEFAGNNRSTLDGRGIGGYTVIPCP